MPAIPRKKRSIGMAALMVLGMIAGFLVASTASGEEFSTVGTVAEDNQAYVVPLQEGQQARFVLQADGGAENADARFAVYDPEDAFFGYFDLAGNGDDVEMLADQSGEWVVFVTRATNADLAVQLEGADENSSAQLDTIEVEEHERTIASRDGGSMDEAFALRLDQRPAVAFLQYEGDIEGLDATVRTQEGPVYRITDGAANTTENGTVHRSGQTELTPGNLVAGTYKIQATADAFDGELTLVHQTYDRGVTSTAENTTQQVEKPLEDASIVAKAAEHEAYEVPMQGASELVFAVERGAHAKVLVYNSSDDAVQSIEIDGHRSYDSWDDHEENGSEDRAPVELTRVNATDDTHVVFVRHLSGTDELYVALPGVSNAESAEELKIESTEITFEHGAGNETQTAQANLTGGLVGVGIHSEDVLSFERTVTVTGPLGEIAHVEQRASTFGFAMYNAHEVQPEHFSDGTLDLAFEQQSTLGQGETTVHLAHYLR